MKQKPFLPSLLALGAMLLFMSIMPTMCLAQPVSRATALRAATTFLDANGAKTAQLTDVSAKIGFANLYVFTTDQSFVLMAADSRVQPVLGYSLNGPFDVENMPENKRAWIEEYGDAIQSAIERQTRASAEVKQQWQELVEGNFNRSGTVVVGPLVQTRWDQGSPYNLLCPSGTVTGCVATAMAQVMKYWNYPEHGIGNHSYLPGNHPEFGVQFADFNATYYDWNNMTYTYGSSSTSAQKQAVATLMYHCGVSVNMNYCPSSEGGSGAVTATVADALKSFFNYSSEVQHHSRSSYDDETWTAMLKADLDQNMPIQYHGRGAAGGHSFVCDGYTSDNYFHFNWGWGGYADEYYVLDNLYPGLGGIGSGSGIFNDDQGAIFGIHPSECTASAPSNLTYTQLGRTVTLAWTAADGAAGYNIYRNMSLVGTATSTTLTDLALFGDNVYFVRSVDASGALSLSSNLVTVTVGYQTPDVTDLAATPYGKDVHLSWTAPAWCYPTTPTATLNYGEGTPYYLWTSVYYAHRHLASDLAQYAGKAVYKVSSFIVYPGTYSVFVYTKTNNNQPDPNSLVFSSSGIPLSVAREWHDFVLDEPAILTGTDDLWVVMKQENTGEDYPAPSINLSEHNTNAFYAGSSPTSLNDANSNYNCAWLINTYLTDGTYTYNLYRDGEPIANTIADTLYADSGLADGTYTYHLMTNYYGGVTDPSNTVTVTVPGLVTQTVELGDGFTWWTPIVETTLAELEAALGNSGILINSQDGGFVRRENGQWQGTLLRFEPGEMYKIMTQTTGTLTLTGLPLTPAGISILPGYNWFGYTGAATTIATALGDFVPAPDDQIIGQEGSATFVNGQWVGTLVNLEPGKGYIYQSTASEGKTLLLER